MNWRHQAPKSNDNCKMWSITVYFWLREVKSPLKATITSCISLIHVDLRLWVMDSYRQDDKTMRSINNINSLLLSRITGNTFQKEARPATTSHNLIGQIKIIHYKYLGNILKLDSTRMLQRPLTQVHQLGLKSSLLINAPQHNSFQELK